MRFIQYSVILMLGTLLSACGGDDSGGESAPPSPPGNNTTYYAQDAIRQSPLGGQFFIDLSDSMGSADGSEVLLTDVDSLGGQPECTVLSMEGKGFTIAADQVKVCDYRYHVGGSSEVNAASQATADAQATVRAAVGEEGEQLVPLSATTSTATAVTINIEEKLGRYGYDLDTDNFTLSDVVTLPNGDLTGSTATANASSNEVLYTPGAGIPSGVERIGYSYIGNVGSEFEGHILLGAIDVAVSETGNNAPEADDAVITEYQDPDDPEALLEKAPNGHHTSTLVEVDVAPYISDLDECPEDDVSCTEGDVLHLVEVYGANFTQLEVITDANDDGNLFNDTVFGFSSKEPGINSVVYVVADGRGGYATGVLQLIVSDVYDDIIVDSGEGAYVFTAPLTEEQSQAAGIEYVGYEGDGFDGLDGLVTAQHAWDVANAYCAASGKRLPTTEELGILNTHVNGLLFAQYYWPVGNYYWSATASQIEGYDYETWNFIRGEKNDGISSEPYFVTCFETTLITTSIDLLGQEDFRVGVNPSYPDPTLEDIVETYSVVAKLSDGTYETVNNTEVDWSITEIPDYVSFDESNGTLIIKPSEIVEGDALESSFVITANYDDKFDTKEIDITLTWNVMLEDDVYQFTPYFTEEQALSMGVAARFVDTDTVNVSYENMEKGYTFDGLEYLEQPTSDYYSDDEYCSSLNYESEGGSWKNIDSYEVLDRYMTSLLENLNALFSVTNGDFLSYEYLVYLNIAADEGFINGDGKPIERLSYYLDSTDVESPYTHRRVTAFIDSSQLDEIVLLEDEGLSIAEETVDWFGMSSHIHTICYREIPDSSKN